jgi:diketogulonate reductase-like aldo/keto reductase
MPNFGLGTFKMDQEDSCQNIIKAVLEMGY